MIDTGGAKMLIKCQAVPVRGDVGPQKIVTGRVTRYKPRHKDNSIRIFSIFRIVY